MLRGFFFRLLKTGLWFIISYSCNHWGLAKLLMWKWQNNLSNILVVAVDLCNRVRNLCTVYSIHASAYTNLHTHTHAFNHPSWQHADYIPILLYVAVPLPAEPRHLGVREQDPLSADSAGWWWSENLLDPRAEWRWAHTGEHTEMTHHLIESLLTSLCHFKHTENMS